MVSTPIPSSLNARQSVVALSDDSWCSESARRIATAKSQHLFAKWTFPRWQRVLHMSYAKLCVVIWIFSTTMIWFKNGKQQVLLKTNGAAKRVIYHSGIQELHAAAIT